MNENDFLYFKLSDVDFIYPVFSESDQEETVSTSEDSTSENSDCIETTHFIEVTDQELINLYDKVNICCDLFMFLVFFIVATKSYEWIRKEFLNATN